jgi:putative phosphoribosyl transferase
MLYADRRQAGQALGAKLRTMVGGEDCVVLALPRGGVPVAFEVARQLSAPLDVFLVRKLGVPGFEELAMGAIAAGGTRVVNDSVVVGLGIPQKLVESVAAAEQHELERRARLYRGNRPALELRGKTAVLVDDGLATGASMRAAIQALRELRPARIVVGVPVAEQATCDALAELVDEIVCCKTPDPFVAVGEWYEDFSQTSDDEVKTLLETTALERRRREPTRLRGLV